MICRKIEWIFRSFFQGFSPRLYQSNQELLCEATCGIFSGSGFRFFQVPVHRYLGLEFFRSLQGLFRRCLFLWWICPFCRSRLILGTRIRRLLGDWCRLLCRGACSGLVLFVLVLVWVWGGWIGRWIRIFLRGFPFARDFFLLCVASWGIGIGCSFF